MKNIKRFFVWLVEIMKWVVIHYRWIILPIFLWLFHIVAIPIDHWLSKVIFLATQSTGIFLILKAIDSNLRMFDGDLFKDLFLDPMNAFPGFRKRYVTVEADGCSVSVVSGSVESIPASKRPITVEEKIEYLTIKIEKMDRRIDENRKNIEDRISQEMIEMRNRVREVNRDVEEIRSKVKESYTDKEGLRGQIFGALLAIHAPVVEVLSPLFQ